MCCIPADRERCLFGIPPVPEADERCHDSDIVDGVFDCEDQQFHVLLRHLLELVIIGQAHFRDCTLDHVALLSDHTCQLYGYEDEAQGFHDDHEVYSVGGGIGVVRGYNLH